MKKTLSYFLLFIFTLTIFKVKAMNVSIKRDKTICSVSGACCNTTQSLLENILDCLFSNKTQSDCIEKSGEKGNAEKESSEKLAKEECSENDIYFYGLTNIYFSITLNVAFNSINNHYQNPDSETTNPPPDYSFHS